MSQVRVGVLAPEMVKERRKLGTINPAILLEEMQQRADLLRSTAAELRAGTMNRFHAANRIERIANEIARPKES